jgi:hypothetical protein
VAQIANRPGFNTANEISVGWWYYVAALLAEFFIRGRILSVELLKFVQTISAGRNRYEREESHSERKVQQAREWR